MKQIANRKPLKKNKPKRKRITKLPNNKPKVLSKYHKEMIEKLTIMSIKNKREQEKLCQNLD